MRVLVSVLRRTGIPPASLEPYGRCSVRGGAGQSATASAARSRSRRTLTRELHPSSAVTAQLTALAILAAITSPTAIAAVLVILHRPHPVRLLAAYLAGSFLASLTVGALILAGLNASGIFGARSSTATPILDIVIGAVILTSAAWLSSERSMEVRRRAVARRERHRAAQLAKRGGQPGASARIINRGSVALLLALGAAMHLPGLLYLDALAKLSHQNQSTSRTVLALFIFNVIMLAPLELPLAGFVLDAPRTEQMVTALNSFIRQHRRSGLLAACVAVGGYLVLSGVIALIG